MKNIKNKLVSKLTMSRLSTYVGGSFPALGQFLQMVSALSTPVTQQPKITRHPVTFDGCCLDMGPCISSAHLNQVKLPIHLLRSDLTSTISPPPSHGRCLERGPCISSAHLNQVKFSPIIATALIYQTPLSCSALSLLLLFGERDQE